MRTRRLAALLIAVSWLSSTHLLAQQAGPKPAKTAAVPPTGAAAAAGSAAQGPAAPKPAAPAVAHDARTDRLQGLNRADLALLEPALQAGPVALVEFADDDADELPAINAAAIVHAKPSELLAVVQKPETYPGFMHTLDEVEVVRRDGPSVVYDWRWRMALLSLEGRNAMTLYAPPPDRLDAGYRVTIDSQSGDLGTGRMSLRILPHGERETLLCVSLRIDLRNANYIARKMADAARSVNRSANMSLTYAMLLSFRHEAERRAGYRAPERPAAELHQPVLDTIRIMPLLARGDLVLMDMNGDRLDQISVFGVIHHRRELVREVMLDADAFGNALLPGSAAKVVSKEGPLTTFEWNIAMPLMGISGRMQLRDADPLIAVDAVEGALQGGRWKFETRALTKHVTLLASWASFDVRNSTWLVRALADADPYLGHGITAASEIMLERALRTETIERAEKLAQAARAKKKQQQAGSD